ncbi:unnamed protein product [Allacma fusca]|uniref:Uncharacterized protein n=1 Tax=Allacma fusca TaxID=39272 RepID=A0A8J2L4N4_9HEXA|nr:unnamed protein product [Allacma fusca]
MSLQTPPPSEEFPLRCVTKGRVQRESVVAVSAKSCQLELNYLSCTWTQRHTTPNCSPSYLPFHQHRHHHHEISFITNWIYLCKYLL